MSPNVTYLFGFLPGSIVSCCSVSAVAKEVQPFSTEYSNNDKMSGSCSSDGLHGCVFEPGRCAIKLFRYLSQDNFISISD